MRNIIFMLLIAFTSLSCEKRYDTNLKSKQVFIVSDNSDDSMLKVEFSPKILVKGILIGTNLNYHSEDSFSIDLKGNGVKDLQFKYIENYRKADINESLYAQYCQKEDCIIDNYSNIEFASINNEGI